LIAPINTLDLHWEDLIDDAIFANIIEKNEGSADAKRWVATLSLRNRDLTGANLQGADVRHVDFTQAILSRAYLGYVWAKKARFDKAQLRGAGLYGAQLQGASLETAQLRGASASLEGAGFQGASLEGAQLQGASFVDVCLWRADARQAAWEDTRVAETGPKEAPRHVCDWTAASFAALKKLIGEVPEGDAPGPHETHRATP
jgi:uncharacterized protein YjbI with pentapeptide repeats